jgi:hypothetical protein
MEISSHATMMDLDVNYHDEPMDGTKRGSAMTCETMGVKNQQLQRANEAKEEEEEEEEETDCSATDDDDAVPAQGSQGPPRSRRSRRRKKIEFSETVRVMLIPSHADYDNEEKEAIWASKKAIAAMASNNFIEFAAEGWDWRNVVEDDDMIQVPGGDENGGVKMQHPIHSNPYLKDALIRGIPYPIPARAVTPPDGCVEQADATMMMNATGNNGEDDNDDDDDNDNDENSGGAVSFDCLPYEIERPASPFLHRRRRQSDDDHDDDENYDDDSSGDNDDNDDDDDALLHIDPDKYLRRRMLRNLRARTTGSMYYYDVGGGVGC